MRRYFDYAILWDVLLATAFGFLLFKYHSHLGSILHFPKVENINGFGIALITVSATLIGFLLTIVTVIVTFKKGFEDKSGTTKEKPADTSEDTLETVFDKKISKEVKFYSSSIHKKVVDIFVFATYEIGMILTVLLLIQFNIFNCSHFYTSIISASVFLMIILTVSRCLYIFRLFLRVHIHDEDLNKNK